MKTLTSVVAVTALLMAGAAYAQSSNMPTQGGMSDQSMSSPSPSGGSAARARSSSRASRDARENRITAELNREQLAAPNTQQAIAPAPGASVPGAASPTVVNGKVIPPGASCGTDNPSCAGHVQNPAVNSPSQLRLYHAQ